MKHLQTIYHLVFVEGIFAKWILAIKECNAWYRDHTETVQYLSHNVTVCLPGFGLDETDYDIRWGKQWLLGLVGGPESDVTATQLIQHYRPDRFQL